MVIIHQLLDLCVFKVIIVNNQSSHILFQKQIQNQYNKLINKISLIKEEGNLQKDKVKEYQDRFKEELSNDLNTANSITVLYDLIKDDTINGTTKIYLIKDFDKVLSLDLIKEKDSIDSELEKYIQDKIEERKIAKQNKDYALSDTIRDELLSKGIELIDTREGTTYKIKQFLFFYIYDIL